MSGGELRHSDRGRWQCSYCGETGGPPRTLLEHLDIAHPRWRYGIFEEGQE